MEFHPLVELFPALEGEPLKALAGDIKEHGLLEPILLYEGKIIDGRNRYLACRAVGVEPAYREWSGDGIASLVQSLNVHRRHLTKSQRALIALELLPKIQAEAKARQIRKPINSVPPKLAEQNHHPEAVVTGRPSPRRSA